MGYLASDGGVIVPRPHRGPGGRTEPQCPLRRRMSPGRRPPTTGEYRADGLRRTPRPETGRLLLRWGLRLRLRFLGRGFLGGNLRGCRLRGALHCPAFPDVPGASRWCGPTSPLAVSVARIFKASATPGAPGRACPLSSLPCCSRASTALCSSLALAKDLLIEVSARCCSVGACRLGAQVSLEH